MPVCMALQRSLSVAKSLSTSKLAHLDVSTAPLYARVHRGVYDCDASRSATGSSLNDRRKHVRVISLSADCTLMRLAVGQVVTVTLPGKKMDRLT